ncbi:MAG: FAD-dependent oxidoreductase, partial [Kineosporiaceae bacterium]
MSTVLRRFVRRRRARSSRPPKILILGGGYVGLYTALRLQSRLRRDEAEITVVEPRSYMTYQPFLPEASAGSLSPRHVVVPLRRVLRGCTVVNARVIDLDHERRTATLDPVEGPSFQVGYDVVVVALGSVSRTLPIPGLADHAVGFKTVEEAIYLRNQVLHSLDVAESTTDPQRRARALSVVVVGGGYAGVEALAELEDLARDATRYYRTVSPDQLRFTLVEATDRVLPEVGPEMGRYTVEQLRRRGIDVRLDTRLESCTGGHVALSDGTRFDSDTLVWTAGVKPSPALAHLGLPLDGKGRLRCGADLRVDGVTGAWGAGDSAAVPDLTRPGELCGPSAQHAVRQARQLADNIVATLRGREPEPYRHGHAGSVASLGLYQGVA